MRIGFNATYLDPYPTGIGEFIKGTLNEFYKLHSNIMVFTGYPRFLNIDPQRIVLTSKKFFPSHGRKGQFHRILWAKIILPRLTTKYKINILVNLWPEGPIYSHVKTVTVVEDLQPLIFPKEYRKMAYYFRYIVPLILKNSVKIVAISHNTKKDLIRFYNLSSSKIKVIHIGVDVSYFEQKIKEDEIIKVKNKYKVSRYILTVGDHYPRKNFIRLIQAFSSLNLPHKLIIAGNPYPRFTPLIKQAIKRFNCEKKIIITGYVSKKELRSLYQGAELFVFPSLYEGFGKPPLEAMAAGLPVIASNTSSLPEIVDKAAILIEPENIQQIGDAIVTVLRDKKLRENLIIKGKERIKAFNYKNFCKEFLKVLKEI